MGGRQVDLLRGSVRKTPRKRAWAAAAATVFYWTAAAATVTHWISNASSAPRSQSKAVATVQGYTTDKHSAVAVAAAMAVAASLRRTNLMKARRHYCR
jgi:hypothetical protein